MKVRTVGNGEIHVTCEVCNEPLKAHEIMNMSVLDLEITAMEQYNGVKYPFTKDIPVGANIFKHVACESNKVLTMDDIKMGINSLTHKEQQSVYIYLRDTWGCRL